jgi:hypothetical protein
MNTIFYMPMCYRSFITDCSAPSPRGVMRSDFHHFPTSHLQFRVLEFRYFLWNSMICGLE